MDEQTPNERPVYTPGRKYRVSVKGGPAIIVVPGEEEHPFDTLRRVRGTVASFKAFELHEIVEESAEPVATPEPEPPAAV